MAPSKQMSRAENSPSRNFNDINNLPELYTLQENNRDLAKLLADKRKENTELKEVEQRYIVLESKFKMHREIHQSSLSKLEEMFENTCSQLSGVVENLACLHSMLKEEKAKLNFMMDESGNTTNAHINKQLSPTLPQSLKFMTSVLSEVSQVNSQNSHNRLRNGSPTLGDQMSCSIGTIDEGRENNETASADSHLINHSHPEYVSPTGKESVNTSITETYHFSFDERFKSFVVDDETIVRRGGGSPILAVECCRKKSTLDKTLNTSDNLENGKFAYAREHIVDDIPPYPTPRNYRYVTETVPFRRVSDSNGNENRRRDTSNITKDVVFEKNLTRILYPHSLAQISKSPAHYSPKEIRNRLSNSLSMTCISDSSLVDMSQKQNDSPSRSLQFFNQSHRKSDKISELQDASGKESRNDEHVNQTIFYSDPPTPQISVQRYRCHITMGPNAATSSTSPSSSSSNVRNCDGKENISSTLHSKSSQKNQGIQSQTPRRPLHERRSDTIIISNQTIKKSSQGYVSQNSPPEKRSWLRGPRNFDTDVSKPANYSSFRSMKHVQDTGDSCSSTSTNNPQNKRNRRKTRAKKKENIRI